MEAIRAGAGPRGCVRPLNARLALSDRSVGRSGEAMYWIGTSGYRLPEVQSTTKTQVLVGGMLGARCRRRLSVAHRLVRVFLSGPCKTELSLSQKSARRPGCRLWNNIGTGANQMPLRDMDREQMWLLPPTLEDLLPPIIQRGLWRSSSMPWTGRTGQSSEWT